MVSTFLAKYPSLGAGSAVFLGAIPHWIPDAAGLIGLGSACLGFVIAIVTLRIQVARLAEVRASKKNGRDVPQSNI